MPNVYRPEQGVAMGGYALRQVVAERPSTVPERPATGSGIVEVQGAPACHFISQLTANAIAWAREAGKIALHYFKNVSINYKSDNSVLTQADLEIERFLVGQIRRTYPDHALLGEEGARLLHPASNRVDESDMTLPAYTWAIDPLDGTTAFVQGLPGWGISMGLLHAGQPIFGLFYMPLLDDLTYTTHDGILCNGQPLQQTVRPDWGRKGFMAVSTGAHYDYEINVLRTRALGSVSASLVYTARGTATAAFIPKAYLWDIVAGACILKQASGTLRYLSGKPIDYNSLTNGHMIPEPIIAGHPDLLAELQGAIRRRVARA